MASFISTVIAPAALRSSAVTGSRLRFWPMTMRPKRSRMSRRLVVSARIAITSLATLMSKPVCARATVAAAAQSGHDVAQVAVVHIQHAPPGDAVRVDIQRVALVDVVVDHGRQQVVGRGDGVDVAGHVEVELLHRHDLAVAAAGRAALDAEGGPLRRLADGDGGGLADVAACPGRDRLWWWTCLRPAAWA